MFFNSLSKIIEKAMPSIGVFGYIFPRDKKQLEISMRGTTFNIREDGYFLTCKHVYDQIPNYAKQSVKIWLFDRKADITKNYPPFDAEFVTDNNEFDFAIFKIKNCPFQLRPFKLGDSDKVIAGQDVIFSGFPSITMEASKEKGLRFTFATRKCIVSNVKKHEKSGDNLYFLFDSECNEGFSGSPFISVKDAKVVGYVARRFRQLSQKADDIDKPAMFGMAFPINTAKNVLKEI